MKVWSSVLTDARDNIQMPKQALGVIQVFQYPWPIPALQQRLCDGSVRALTGADSCSGNGSSSSKAQHDPASQ
jgi:hypothetical protein